MAAVADLCRRTNVRRLDLFGSALGEQFDPVRSDLDFLVAFDDAPVGGFRGSWFVLHDGLETLFGRSIDLVED